ncbi:hypothetical protein BDP55DRAFT_642692 [Colletotrichum godetiae]|uniref:Secreted protein n=1 Tax=Colletotrichum godetiae TaxID=1209918 RepID=A0AAJ0EZQ6_9PEZI|nr:uncharacterized protein BDP55DRAFT_642692 [Colletotrichum godetiae]KAK1700363.1 hypothetical protein BDP55DRAFT_642692 [Colletotrichum godetiae]
MWSREVLLLVCWWRGEGKEEGQVDKRGFRCVSFWEAPVQREQRVLMYSRLAFVAGAWDRLVGWPANVPLSSERMEVDGLT